MKRLFLALLLLCCGNLLHAQLDFINDNKLYPTLDPSELYQFLRSHPDAVLVDVRSAGEFSDTSRYGSLNIGHLKGAINIEVDSITANPQCLKAYEGRPVILYCSHSQRSRRGSKALSENGFKNVYNLNGGMSYINQASETDVPHKKDLLVSGLSFRNISADETAALLDANKNMLVIDLRSATEFAGKDSLESNNLGRIKTAINIPDTALAGRLSEISKHKDRPVLVYDFNGALSYHAAKLLTEKGFTRVYNLTGGLQAIIGKERSNAALQKKLLIRSAGYQLLNAKEGIDFLRANKDAVILDVRTAEEAANKSDKAWKNLGNIRNAVNIPAAEFDSRIDAVVKDKEAKILVYGSDEKAMNCCRILAERGFKNVNYLYGGLWSVISNSANTKGMKSSLEFLEHHDGIY